MKIAFIGAGRWAITLALTLNRKGNEVKMWEFSKEKLDILLKTRKISDLPDTILIPDSIYISNTIEEVLETSEVVFFAVPSQSLRSVLIKISPFRFSSTNKLATKTPILVSAMKGLENSTNKRISEILNEFYPAAKIVALVGPGIPYEIAEGKPASLVAVSDSNGAARSIQEILSYENLRVYTHSDVIGAELGGALKNVIAIATGICDGLKLGDNAKAALLTRGLAEITRLGIAMNANPMTFAGLSGIGDLIVTAYSPYSRNHLLGVTISRGIHIEQAIRSMTGIAEGAATTISAKSLGLKMHLELPIIEEINSILFQNHDITKSIKRLMQRPLKKETNNENS
jgi:glycerol-3-phosphate dehydrogenase (NAD(P)+)